MAKPRSIQLGRGGEIPILYEDRSVLAIDKPSGWMLVPSHWENTARNLQLAIDSSIRAGEFWAKSRNLRFLRFVHRLDADTTGILLFSKSPGSVAVYSKMFESRQMEKVYLAVVDGVPKDEEWTVKAPLGPEPNAASRMRVDANGKEAETLFTVIERHEESSLLRVRPMTGRMHQIRVHLAHSGYPVRGDRLYGKGKASRVEFPMGLRAVELAYADPFLRKRVRILADSDAFCRAFGFVKRLPKTAPQRGDGS